MTTAAKTEAELFDALAERYCAPRHILLPHVRNATGWKGQRTADALALELWPMDGMHLIGFEMKSSRSDWLRELKQQRKHEAVAQFCDAWIVVAGAADIVRDGELPVGWGLMVWGDGGLRAKVAPAERSPAMVTREFLAAIVRRALACSPHGLAVETRAKEIGEQRVREARQAERDARNEARNWKARFENMGRLSTEALP